ncbi:glycoside hydrolase family 140 protein [Tunicatimonas pelagia]|uniref:glycoside hydrolase family 140 protein n=1 Tax=Tunicatimonas pelagia TaxID=931531 RepID=UPI002665E8B1|nr:glycoside hydrolase family 140 protein [Tunicatimonas pelagia]WKN41719.1 glycoside hydrolase family 140 protein [Tunicatimonas pelagia]
MNRFLVLAFFLFNAFHLNAQRLMVHENGRYLVTEDGEPFFWLADTAWELFHRCDREEATTYLEKRASQGFNVVQAVALAEIDGLNTPNPYGNKPLLNNDPNKPNDAYFEHVDFIISKADELGIYIALLPTWGDKVNTKSWGVGPVVFNPDNARAFGEWMGDRYQDYDNIVWVIGGDRNPRENSDDVAIWNSMAEGIAATAGGYDNTLMTFHPQPTEEGEGGSSTWFHNEEWLDFNMHQTGHCANKGTYKHIEHDYALSPTKPVLDGEPLYENHPHCFNAKERGYSTHDDIRRTMYWNVFAGAFGQTYGCHAVWQMWKPEREPINQPLGPWSASLDLPMANQVKHLKNLMLSRPFLTRVPDQAMVVGTQTDYTEYASATRDEGGRYAMIYLPHGSSRFLDLTALSGEKLSTWWYDPRTGNSFPGEELEKAGRVEIEAPTSGKAHDWVLVIDSEEYDAPGTTSSDQ